MKKFFKNKRRILVLSSVLASYAVGIVVYFVDANVSPALSSEEIYEIQNPEEPSPLEPTDEEPPEEHPIESEPQKEKKQPEKPSDSQKPATAQPTPKATETSTPPPIVAQKNPVAQQQTAPSPAVPSVPSNNYTDEVVMLCNIERQNAGISELLNNNSSLQQAVNLRAIEIAQNFSHTRPNGKDCFSVLKEFGILYTACGENIAYGQKNPQEVVNGWMNSPGHRANILNANFNKIAVGLSGTYWVQLFIKG